MIKNRKSSVGIKSKDNREGGGATNLPYMRIVWRRTVVKLGCLPTFFAFESVWRELWRTWARPKCKYHQTVCLVCFCSSRLMSSMEDLLFYTITEGQDMVPLTHFISVSYRSHSHTKDFVFSAPTDKHMNVTLHMLQTPTCTGLVQYRVSSKLV